VDERIRETLNALMALSELGDALHDRGRQAYDADPLLQLAGEAIMLRGSNLIARLPIEFKVEYPQVNWSGTQETREAIRYGFEVDYDLVWTVLERRRPANAQAIREILDQAAPPSSS